MREVVKLIKKLSSKLLTLVIFIVGALLFGLYFSAFAGQAHLTRNYYPSATAVYVYWIGLLLMLCAVIFYIYLLSHKKKIIVKSTLIIGVILFSAFYSYYEYVFLSNAFVPKAILWATYPMGIYALLSITGLTFIVISILLYCFTKFLPKTAHIHYKIKNEPNKH